VSIYEELGGNTGIKAAVTVFYHRVLADELLAPWFEGIDLARLRSHQRAFLAAALGGPDLFAGRDLLGAHRGMAITDEAFDALLEHLAESLHDLGVRDELVAEVRARVDGMRAQVVSPASSPTPVGS